jgi:WD40 repeat protein
VIVLAGAKGEVTHLALSADGRVLAASGGGRKLELWDAAAANKWGKYTRGMSFKDGSVAFHPTEPVCFASSLLAIAEIETDTKKGRMLEIPGKKLTKYGPFAPTRDGTALVCHCGGDYFTLGELHCLGWKRGEGLRPIWKLNLSSRKERLTGFPRPVVIHMNPDGQTFLTLDGPFVLGLHWWGDTPVSRVTICSVADGKLLQQANLPADTPSLAAFAPDGRSFVTCRASVLTVWDADNLKKKPRAIKGDSRSRLTGVAFHPSGKFLAAACNDKTVKLYDTAAWKVAKTLTWDIGRLRSVCFSPDGTLAAAGSDSGKVVVWDVDV